MVVGIAFYIQRQSVRSQMEQETVELLVMLNRGGSFSEENLFWMSKDLLIGVPQTMEIESKTILDMADKKEKELNHKYGYGRPGLGGLNPQRREEYGLFKEKSEDGMKRILNNAYDSALSELIRSPTKSKKEVFHSWARRGHEELSSFLKKLETDLLMKK
jgi:hypothetical protein